MMVNYRDKISLASRAERQVVERLEKHKPSTLGQASRLEGVTPAAINLIAITIKKSELLVKAK